MNASDRNKAALLESILAKQAAFEQRTLADLHRAGFKFTTITAAKQRLQMQRTFHGFTQQQMDIAIAVADQRARRRTA